MSQHTGDLPLLYAHGFASSGRSNKGRLLRRHFPQVYAPSLSHIPELAIDTLEQFIELLGGRCLLVGSSLGGFYARWLAAAHALPAVLVNPALEAPTLLRQAVGQQLNYHDGSQFEWTEQHLSSLARLIPQQEDQARLLVMVQMGDEVIDHRHTLDALPGAEVSADPAGDHAFTGFAERMELIAAFGRRFA